MSAILTTICVMSLVAYIVGMSDSEENKLRKVIKFIVKIYCCCLAFVFITIVTSAGFLMWIALLLLD